MWILVKNYCTANRNIFLWSIIPFVAMTSLIYWIQHSIVFMVFLCTIVYISSFMKTEEKNNTDILYRSLPIKPSSIVYSRYIAAAVSCAGIFLPSLLACSFIEPHYFPGLTESSPVITGAGFFIITVPIAILVAGIFPFSFKYGYMKGRLLGSVASILAGVTLMAILYAIVSLSGKTEILTAVMAQTERSWITRFSLEIFAQAEALMGKEFFLAFISSVTVILLAVSVKASVRFYNNRDF